MECNVGERNGRALSLSFYLGGLFESKGRLSVGNIFLNLFMFPETACSHIDRRRIDRFIPSYRNN